MTFFGPGNGGKFMVVGKLPNSWRLFFCEDRFICCTFATGSLTFFQLGWMGYCVLGTREGSQVSPGDASRPWGQVGHVGGEFSCGMLWKQLWLDFCKSACGTAIWSKDKSVGIRPHSKPCWPTTWSGTKLSICSGNLHCLVLLLSSFLLFVFAFCIFLYCINLVMKSTVTMAYESGRDQAGRYSFAGPLSKFTWDKWELSQRSMKGVSFA